MSVFSLFDGRKAAKHAGFYRECRGTFEVEMPNRVENAVAADVGESGIQAAH